ncbi:hypothetical protein J1614_005538 [Plenodomus biglobosus]|nr:hypothetical protein J1614_005538 [Plenodomus biglobosus]
MGSRGQPSDVGRLSEQRQKIYRVPPESGKKQAGMRGPRTLCSAGVEAPNDVGGGATSHRQLRTDKRKAATCGRGGKSGAGRSFLSAPGQAGRRGRCRESKRQRALLQADRRQVAGVSGLKRAVSVLEGL